MKVAELLLMTVLAQAALIVALISSGVAVGVALLVVAYAAIAPGFPVGALYEHIREGGTRYWRQRAQRTSGS